MAVQGNWGLSIRTMMTTAYMCLISNYCEGNGSWTSRKPSIMLSRLYSSLLRAK